MLRRTRIATIALASMLLSVSSLQAAQASSKTNEDSMSTGYGHLTINYSASSCLDGRKTYKLTSTSYRFWRKSSTTKMSFVSGYWGLQQLTKTCDEGTVAMLHDPIPSGKAVSFGTDPKYPNTSRSYVNYYTQRYTYNLPDTSWIGAWAKVKDNKGHSICLFEMLAGEPGC